jgi:hypothetical protein
MTGHLTPSRRAAVDALLKQNRETIAAGGRGRLIFALDATASRQPTWDAAGESTAAMFEEAAKIGGLQAQLVFFRGHECRASDWTANAHALADKMRKISCVTGTTQIARVLAHVHREHRQKPVNAAIFIGDAVEESPLRSMTRRRGCPLCFCFRKATIGSGLPGAKI